MRQSSQTASTCLAICWRKLVEPLSDTALNTVTLRIGFYIRSMQLLSLTSKVSVMLTGQRWTMLGTLTQRLECPFHLLMLQKYSHIPT